MLSQVLDLKTCFTEQCVAIILLICNLQRVHGTILQAAIGDWIYNLSNEWLVKLILTPLMG